MGIGEIARVDHGRSATRRIGLWLRLGFASAIVVGGLVPVAAGLAHTWGSSPEASPTAGTPDLEVAAATVRHVEDLDVLVFELRVAGEAGATTPEPRGALDGAPVLGYVVPTTLPPTAVGFAATEGTVALAVTAHPDFDDTPLWDENGDGDYANDGALWHAHWVLIGPDERVPGGLAVKEVAEAEVAETLPPTNPGLPLYLDSPGFSVQLQGEILRVVVPTPRVAGETGFSFDVATAYLEVNTSDDGRPMLGVYDVYGVLSGDLSLPYSVEEE
jgi:hypothetical protein